MFARATDTFTKACRHARQPQLAPFTALVVAAWAIAGLALLLVAGRELTFTPATHAAAVGWTTVNHYPKQQEWIYFLFAVIGVPAVCGLGWLIWIATAMAAADRTFRKTAFGSLAWLILLPRLVRLDATVWKLFLAALGIMAVWIALCALYNRWRPASVPEQEELPAAAPLAGRPRCRSRWIGIVAGLLVYVIAPGMLYALRYYPVIDGGVDLFHEAEFLVPVNEMRHGGVPYRDIYLQHGLFHNALIPLLGAQLFGPTLAGVRTMQHFIEPVGVVALYFFALMLFRGRFLTAAVVAYALGGAGLYALPRMTFGLLALAFIAAAIPTGKRWQWIAAGVCSALAFWHSVEVGLYTGLAITVFLALDNSERRFPALRWYAVGGVAGFWLVGWYFLIHGALFDVARNVFVQCAYQNEVWGLPFPKFWDAFVPLLQHPRQIEWPKSFTTEPMLFYLPPIMFTIAAIYLLYRFARGNRRTPAARKLLLLVATGICFFRTALGRSDGAHLTYAIVFGLLTALYLPDQLLTFGLLNLFRRRVAGLVPVILGGVAAWLVVSQANVAYRSWPALQAGWQRLRSPPPRTQAKAVVLERAGLVALPDGQVESLRKMIQLLQEHTKPDEPVFDFTNQAGHLFFADRRSATRYFHIVYAVTESAQREVTNDLARLRPVAILTLNSGNEGFDGVLQSKRTPIIAEYLAAHYRREPVTGSTWVLGTPQPDAAKPSP